MCVCVFVYIYLCACVGICLCVCGGECMYMYVCSHDLVIVVYGIVFEGVQ